MAKKEARLVARLALKALDSLCMTGDRFEDALNRHFTINAGLVRTIDDSHPAPPNFGPNF